MVGVTFVLFQFFLQLSSGVIINSIMTEMKLSALMAGILSSSFYLIYTIMQIPVGILFDRQSTRLLLSISAIVCSFGCFLFSQSHTVAQLIIARILIGAGSSFAFVGLSQLLRHHFSLRHFSFMIGLSETLGFMVTMLGMLSLGDLISHWGWRIFFQGTTIIGLGIAIFAWVVIPHQTISIKKASKPPSSIKILNEIMRNPLLWVNGIYVALGFMVITVFAAMWAVPFLQIKLQCNLNEASQLDAMLFLGVAISCPLLGQLSSSLKKRTPLLIYSSIITGSLLLLLLYLPIHHFLICGMLLFLIGLSCGSYMVVYSISNELAPENAKSTATGFTNTLATLTPLIQPIIGRFIDILNEHNPSGALWHYQLALTILPAGLFIAARLAIYLPERDSKN